MTGHPPEVRSPQHVQHLAGRQPQTASAMPTWTARALKSQDDSVKLMRRFTASTTTRATGMPSGKGDALPQITQRIGATMRPPPKRGSLRPAISRPLWSP